MLRENFKKGPLSIFSLFNQKKQKTGQPKTVQSRQNNFKF